MKRILSTLLVIAVTILLAACSTLPVEQTKAPQENQPAPQVTPPAPQQNPPTPESQKMVVFADPTLEAMVCEAMGKPICGITLAEAEALTTLDLSFEWRQHFSGTEPIRDIGGLEHFINLEYLDLSDHAITDLTPLAGLTRLTVLVLGGNPIADIAPLANLTSLEFLMLNNSAITDAAPLAALTNLKRLYLAGCALYYSPLADIYTNLEDKDFVIPSTLTELGFIMNYDNHQAEYQGEDFDLRINHDKWGFSGEEWTQNVVMLVFEENIYKVYIGYYPAEDLYVVQAHTGNGMPVNYIYICAKRSYYNIEERESFEQHIRAIFPDAAEDGDLLWVPIRFLDNTLQSAFGMTAEELFDLPFAPPSLTLFGFVPLENNTAYAWGLQEPHDINLTIYRPEWGPASDGQSVEFYNDDLNGYQLLIYYFANEGKYHLALFKHGTKIGNFDSYPKEDKFGWEYPDIETVRQTFNAVFNTDGDAFFHAAARLL